MRPIRIIDYTGDEPVERVYTQKDIMKKVNELADLLTYCDDEEFVNDCINNLTYGDSFDIDEDDE